MSKFFKKIFSKQSTLPTSKQSSNLVRKVEILSSSNHSDIKDSRERRRLSEVVGPRDFGLMH